MKGLVAALLILTSVTVTAVKNCTNGDTMPNYFDCRAYYLCENGTFVENYCPFGLHYNCMNNMCEFEICDSCCRHRPRVHRFHQRCLFDGVRVADPDRCDVYYECFKHHFLEVMCAPGEQYDNNLEKCVVDTTGNCSQSNTSTTSLNITRRSAPSEDSLTSKSREKRSTNSTHTAQIRSPLCPVDDTTIPDPFNCSFYYVCFGGQPVWFECSSGLVFNCITGQCSSETFAPCCMNSSNTSPSTNSCTEIGYKIPDYYDCSKYFECDNYVMVEKICLFGYSYNMLEMQCDNTTGCIPNNEIASTAAIVTTTTTATTISFNLPFSVNTDNSEESAENTENNSNNLSATTVSNSSAESMEDSSPIYIFFA